MKLVKFDLLTGGKEIQLDIFCEILTFLAVIFLFR